MTNRPSDTRPPVLFVALQTGAAANGGIASLGEVVTAMRRNRPYVLTNREGPVTEGWRRQGIAVTVVSEGASSGLRHAPLATMTSYVRYFRAVRTLLAESGARIVHANDPLAFQLSLAAARSRPGVRIALNIRDTIGPARTPPRRRYRWLFGAADHILFLSRDMLDRWAQIVPGIHEKASVTYSIVDLDRFRPQPLQLSGRPVALVSGVVCPKKGQLDFLQTVSPVLARAGIETWLSGDFDTHEHGYAADCRSAAAPLGEMVRFLGYRADVPDLLASAHVVCVSSHYEGLMRTMIEAMAAGRPIVSTDVASAREMLEQPGREAGKVFPIGCGAAMANEIVRLCRDLGANRKLGANGVLVARKTFDAGRVVSEYEAAYDRLRRRARV